MGDKEDRSPALYNFPDATETLLLEEHISRRQRFINKENVRINADRCAKSEPGLHATRIGLKRLVNDVPQLGKVDDVVELAVDLLTRHPLAHSTHVNILSASKFRMETCAKF